MSILRRRVASPAGPLMARVVALVFAAAAMGACGGAANQARHAPAVSGASTSTPTSGLAATDGTTTTASPAPEPTTANSTRPAPSSNGTRHPTTTGKVGGNSGGAAAPSALAPPPPGTYRYDTTGSSTVGPTSRPFPAVTTLVVDPSDGARQHSRRDLRDSAGNGSAVESTLEYQAGGVILDTLVVTTKADLFNSELHFTPTVPGSAVLLATGSQPGAHREFDLAVTGATNATAHAVIDVLRAEPVTVAGSAVPALVTRVVITVPGAVSARIEMDVWVAPSARLFVKEHSVSDAAAGIFTAHASYDATLQRLIP